MTSFEQLWQAAYDPQVPRHLEYPGGTLVDALERSTSQYAKRCALDFFGVRTSYAKLWAQVHRVAGNLRRLGVNQGDHVALLMPTCPQHVVAFYAVLACGATVVEHNPLATTEEFEVLFADHGARVAVSWDAAAPKLQAMHASVRPGTIISINMIEELPLAKRLLLRLPIKKARETRSQLSQPAPGTVPYSSLLAPAAAPEVALDQDDVALLLYTSGTTGTPKGVPLTHANLLASGTQAITWVTPFEFGTDVFLACLPLFHVFGCSLSMNAGLLCGATIHLIPKPDTALILDAIKRETPTMMIAVPPLFERIVDGAARHGVSLQGITTGISGAMPLNPDLIGKWEQATGGLLIEGYGLSECSPIVAGNPVNRSRTARSIGVPFPDTELRLADPEDPAKDAKPGQPGELLVRGPQVFSGYRNRPEENAAAFHQDWFRTGDVVVADERGFLTIVDRIKELVITGGFNVYPSEVENAMRGLLDIEESAVVGLQGKSGNEEVVAAVVTRSGAKPDLEKLRALLKERLSAYKVPRRVFVVGELPRNEMGKVLRREVRARVEALDLQELLSKVVSADSTGPRVGDLHSWLSELAPNMREKLAEFGPELRERLEKADREFREWIKDRELLRRFDNLDLARRLDVLRGTIHSWFDRNRQQAPGTQ